MAFADTSVGALGAMKQAVGPNDPAIVRLLLRAYPTVATSVISHLLCHSILVGEERV